jgi:hypothetical protein
LSTLGLKEDPTGLPSDHQDLLEGALFQHAGDRYFALVNGERTLRIVLRSSRVQKNAILAGQVYPSVRMARLLADALGGLAKVRPNPAHPTIPIKA